MPAPCQQAASQGCVDGSHRRTPTSTPKAEQKAAEDDNGARKVHSGVLFLLTAGEPPVGRTQELRDMGMLAIEVGKQNETINAP